MEIMTKEERKQLFKDVIENVRLMRKAQKQYFSLKSRLDPSSKAALIVSKRYEQKVDDALDKIDGLSKLTLPLED